MRNIPSIFLPLFLYCFISCVAYAAEPWEFSEKFKNGDIFENIVLAGALKINPGNDTDKKAREISGIAWDNDEQILYGISDDGYIVHMRLILTAENNLQDVEILSVYYLKDETGKDRTQGTDAEGVTLDKANNDIKGDTELVLVLDSPARAERFTNTGQFIGTVTLHSNLVKHANGDQKFEINAVAGNQESGYRYLTRRQLNGKHHLLYIGTDVEQPLIINNETGIEVLGADYIPGDGLYILDRDFKSIWKPVFFCIRHIDDNYQINNIACLNSKDGWKLDNFEAITHYKDNYFLMITDDEENLLQKTLLVMFKVIK